MNSSAAIPVIRSGFLAMGTWVTVSLAVAEAEQEPAAEAAIAEVRALIEQFGRDWWAWGDGALARINRDLAAGETVRIPPAMRPLFSRAWAMREASDGLFEPRIAALVELWGFDEPAHLRSAPPAPEEIARRVADLRAAPGYDGAESYGPAPGVGWDFGGIGKGWIVDQALDLLRSRGFADAIVDAGGNLAARGGRGLQPWRIGVRDPRGEDTTALLASLTVYDEAVNTHGDDQRYFEYQGRRYAHLLDAATGTPVEGLRSLTVVHRDAVLAEAGGAAMYAAGPGRCAELARGLGIAQFLVVDERGDVLASPDLAGRLRPEPGIRLQVFS